MYKTYFNIQEIIGKINANKNLLERKDNTMNVDKKKKWMRIIAIVIIIAFLATFLAYIPF